MATSTELGQSKVVTRDGIVTATLVDRVGPDRITLVLMHGFASAKLAALTDNTPQVSAEIRSLLVNPQAGDS